MNNEKLNKLNENLKAMNTTLKPVAYLKPFPKLCVSMGMIPSSYQDSMTYEEQLLWLMNYISTNIIPVVNENGGNVEELQKLYVELKGFIDNYFDDLDVQQEINNKLDEMVEDGTLESILLDYSNVQKVYKTYQELLQDTTLIAGMKLKTMGYYEVNDGGGAEYVTATELNPNAYVEQVDGLYIELINKDNTINVKSCGAYGDGIHDDTDVIKRIIRALKISNNNKNQNYSDFIAQHNGSVGSTIKFDDGCYLISSTIELPCYISIDLGNAVIKATAGTYISNYMFTINSDDATIWNFAYPTPEGRFVRGGTIDGGELSNINGFYCCDGRKFEELKFNNLSRAIYYPGTINGTRMYIDMIEIRQVTCRNPKNNDVYLFQKNGDGDGFIFKDVHLVDNDTSYKLLRLTNARGFEISDCINGDIEVNRCVGTISNWHNEFGSLLIKWSQVSINNCMFWKYNDNIIPIKISDNNYAYTTNQDTSNVLITNTNIVSFNKLSDYNDISYDIDLSETSFPVQFINCYHEYVTRNYREQSLCGLFIKTSTKNILTQFNNYIIENNTIHSDENINLTNIDFLSTGSLRKQTDTIWKESSGIYYYRVIAFADTDRLLGYTYAEKNIDITNEGDGVIINYDIRGNHNVIIRIYRGLGSGNYTKYVDIPNPKSLHLIDNGYSVNGYKWNDMTAANVPNVTFADNVKYRYISSFDKNSNYNIRIADILCRTLEFNQGTFTKGDIARRINPVAGENVEAICISDDGKTWNYLKLSQ